MATLRQLRIFVVTAQHKKMSMAAKQLFTSQPLISKVISDLEEEYGVELFERHSKELKITPAGEVLLESAKKMVALNEAMTLNMKNFHAIRPLRIGATMSIGSTILPKLIHEFKNLHPDIQIFFKVTNTTHIEMLLAQNELDIALVEGIINNPEVSSKPVFVDQLCFICGKESPFFHKDMVDIQELRGSNFILREKGSGTRAIFENIMKVNHVEYQVQAESASTTGIIEAVSNDLGLGFVSFRSIAKRASAETIHAFTLNNNRLQRFFFTSTLISHPITSQISDWINFIDSLPEDYS